MSDWWKGALIYQIYPRSFFDANNDGIGDLQGITEKLEYIASLNVDGIWISPFFKSPMKDFGYDISDYRAVDPIFGNIDDFKALLDKAHALNLKVIIDQVISHSSDQHDWFIESRKDKTNSKADWYVWADAKEDGSPPNNWLAFFGGSAWTFDENRQQYYLHNFLTSQPDLNFHNPEVQEAQLDNLRFWLDMGVDGFRLDVANFYFHDAQLRDNPVLKAGQHTSVGVTELNPYSQLIHKYDITQAENLPFLEKLRAMLDEYGDRTTMGEINGEDSLSIMADYTRGDKRLHMAYTFDLLTEDKSTQHIRNIIHQLETSGADCWPCWALSNHDVTRMASRWGKGEDPIEFSLLAIAMLISLKGSVCLYQGEELGLTEALIEFEDLQDPYGIEFWPEFKGRDGCRTPMPWNASKNAGFSTVKPWLPVSAAHVALNVTTQNEIQESLLNKARNLIAWRQAIPTLLKGSLRLVDDENVLGWVREYEGKKLLCLFNLQANAMEYELPYKLISILDGHGFSHHLDENKLSLPAYNAFYAEIE